jgi:hypothetical protein
MLDVLAEVSRRTQAVERAETVKIAVPPVAAQRYAQAR